jgi:Arc/MetJ-type ribon-helix-helix transcriptional regulator
MKGKRKVKTLVSVVIPKEVKEDITSLVKEGEFESLSDFLRKAIHKLLDEKAEEKGDLLKERKFRTFLEEIS